MSQNKRLSRSASGCASLVVPFMLLMLIRVAPLDGKETGGASLQEQDHQHQDEDFAVDRSETRLKKFVEAADAQGRHDRAGELADSPGHNNAKMEAWGLKLPPVQIAELTAFIISENQAEFSNK